MPHRSGKSRLQFGLFATPLEEMIALDNPVRVIDAFVDVLDMNSLGFVLAKAKNRGAPAYEPALLLKIYLYGYLNRVRSSRRLETECGRNIELIWLTGHQQPSYHTIATFRSRQEHRKALKDVFRMFNRFCQRLELFGKTLVAIDGTKISAQNSKKNNITEDKIARKLERLDKTFEAYLDELDVADAAGLSEEEFNRDAVFQAMEELIQREELLLDLDEKLQQAQADEPTTMQLSLTDPDARMLPLNNEGMMGVGYNIQSAVDDKHCLVAHFEVTNTKDDYQLAPVTIATKNELGVHALTVLADKGYHTGVALQACADNEIITYVAVPEYGYSGKTKGFRKEDFKYDAERDAYICKAGKQLTTNNQWYEKHGRNGQFQYRFKRYTAAYRTCEACPFAVDCLSDSNVAHSHGRNLERSEFEEAVVANRQRILYNRIVYRRRQAIVEHPFGTIKRSWGFHYTLLKGKAKVEAEYSLVFLAYNLRRALTILGAKGLIEWLNAIIFEKFAFSRSTKDQSAGQTSSLMSNLVMQQVGQLEFNKIRA
ncbi:MAG: IS1182 family transposase [Saprospiraceae bacterium]|nr:IS1182 family transposase [Saprospiraceae bacterium]